MVRLDEIGASLEASRRTRGMTQAELGARVGATQQQVARWERDEYAHAALERVARVAEALGVVLEPAIVAESPAGYGGGTAAAPVRHLGEVVRRLREHSDELRDRFAVSSISVFGSFASGTETPRSDVDLLVEPASGGVTRLSELTAWLTEEVLVRAADVTRADLLRWEIRDDVLREAVRVWSA